MKKTSVMLFCGILVCILLVVIPKYVSAIEPVKGDLRYESQTVDNSISDGDVEFSKVVSKTNKIDEFLVTLSTKSKQNNQQIYVVVVFDMSKSMEQTKNKLNSAKEGAQAFSKTLLAKYPNAQIALITFNNSATLRRNFSNTNFDFVNFGNTSSGKAINLGLDKAIENLKNKEGKKYIVLMTDGEPYIGNNFQRAKAMATTSATNAKNEKIELFAISYETNEAGKTFLKDKIVSSPTSTYYLDANSTSVVSGFNNIAGNIKIVSGTNASITDTISSNFTYVENSITNATINGKTVLCNIGDITEINKSCSFKIKINYDTTPTGWHPTNVVENNGVKISYTNSDNELITKNIDKSAEVYSKQNSYSYTINYYKDSISSENYLNQITGTANYDTLITVDTLKFIPLGYKFVGIIPSKKISSDDNIINVVYIKNNAETKEIKYTVKHYLNGIYQNEDDFTAKETVWINNPNISVLYELNENKYIGYKLVSNDLEEFAENNQVFNVYYESDVFNYQVEYYYDGILDDTKTELLMAKYGSIIKNIENKSGEKYTLSKTDNLPLTIDVENKTIKVYYVSAEGKTIKPPATGNSNNYSPLIMFLGALTVGIKIRKHLI